MLTNGLSYLKAKIGWTARKGGALILFYHRILQKQKRLSILLNRITMIWYNIHFSRINSNISLRFLVIII